MDDEDQAMKNEKGTAKAPRPRKARADSNGNTGNNQENQEGGPGGSAERRLVIGTHAQFAFNGANLRLVDEDRFGWFVAPDACAVLGLRNASRALARLDDDEKGITIVHTPGGPQRVLVVSESGLYRLIIRSRKPEAVAFRRWVFGEVLPTIRRTGSYQTGASRPEAQQHKGGFAIELPDAHPGVYVATILQDLSTRVRRADFPALFAEIDAFDAQIMASALTTIAGYWHKAELLRSMDIDLDDGVALAGLESSIREGNKVARHFLFHFLRRAAEADAELSNRPTPGDKTH